MNNNEFHQFNELTFATLIPLQKSILPSTGNKCNLEKTFPTSLVNCVTTRPLKAKMTLRKNNQLSIHSIDLYSASVNNPTLFSGFDLVFAWKINETASCCACILVGIKSPSRIKSLLSILEEKQTPLIQYSISNASHHIIVLSNGMICVFFCIQRKLSEMRRKKPTRELILPLIISYFVQ